ncbi:MAG: hypothetical protein LBV02_02105 [Bacteroidales bacterium]|nr:hypothetical protein [Bacteroidales bacterium]
MDDWLDKPIEKNFQKLSDIAGDFFGDEILISSFGAKNIGLGELLYTHYLTKKNKDED